MCAIGLMLAMYYIQEASMDVKFEGEESNVDHFLISTRENQFLLIFVDQATTLVKEVSNRWEE